MCRDGLLPLPHRQTLWRLFFVSPFTPKHKVYRTPLAYQLSMQNQHIPPSPSGGSPLQPGCLDRCVNTVDLRLFRISWSRVWRERWFLHHHSADYGYIVCVYNNTHTRAHTHCHAKTHVLTFSLLLTMEGGRERERELQMKEVSG